MAVNDEKNITDVPSRSFYAKSFLAGGIAGMCAKTTVAPLDRLKVLLQAHNQHYKHLGVLSGLQNIVKKEGFLGLYKGNGAQMVRIFPYAAAQFGSFEVYKRFLRDQFGFKTHATKFLSGSLAGVTAVIFTYPLDVVRARLAFQVTERMYSGIFNALTCIAKTEGGLRGLYKGLFPTILGMIPYAGLSFYGFGRMKAFCLEHMPNVCGRWDENSSGGLVLTIPAKLLCGGFAGAMAQTVSYPLDVARRKMQLSMMNPETHKYGKGFTTTLAITFRENGIVKGLYRGMSINYLRAIPMVAISFSSYEVTKQLLGLDTGVDSL